VWSQRKYEGGVDGQAWIGVQEIKYKMPNTNFKNLGETKGETMDLGGG